MGNLVDKEAVSFVTSDLRIPSPLSDPQAPKQAGSPPQVAQMRTADSSSAFHNQEVTTGTSAAEER